MDNIPYAVEEDGIFPGSSLPVRVPAFARNVAVTAVNPAGSALRLLGPASDAVPLDVVRMDSTVNQATIALPGDCVSVILDNYNLEQALTTPALMFELAL